MTSTNTNRIIIDGSNLLHRCYWVSTAVRNVPVALLFSSSIKKLAKEYKCNNIYVVWDSRTVRGRKNFRQKQITYKQTRDKSKNEKVFSHEELCVEMSKTLGVKHLNPGILEADDYIRWLVYNSDKNSIIVSSDGDMIQLVNRYTSVLNPITSKHITYDNFTEITGLQDTNELIIFKCLVGDKSDNIDGLAGVGPKTAKKIINEGVESLPSEKYEIYQHNRELIDLSVAPEKHPNEYDRLEKNYNEVESVNTLDINAFAKLCAKHNMKSALSQLGEYRSVFTKTGGDIGDVAARLIQALN